MSNYACEECTDHSHSIYGENSEYEYLHDLAELEISQDHHYWCITGKDCPVPEWYTKIAETENMVLYKENN